MASEASSENPTPSDTSDDNPAAAAASTAEMEVEASSNTAAAATQESPAQNKNKSNDNDGTSPPRNDESSTDSLPLDDSDDDDDDDNDDENPSKTSTNQDPTTLILQAVTHKEDGNTHFKSGDLTQASRSYRRGTSLLKHLNKANTGDDQVKSLLLSLQTNLSMVCLKQNKPKQSRDVATKALTVDATHVKALYRRAAAHRTLGNVEEAKVDLRTALLHDPNNREVKRELLSIKREVEEKRRREKSALARAFSSRGGSSFLYNDKEEEERLKLEKKKKEKEKERLAKEKRKSDWEDDCVKRLAEGGEAVSFEEWEKERKERMENEEKARKKAKKEEEERRRSERAAARKSKKENSDDTLVDDDEDLTEKELQMFRGYKKTSDGRTTSYFSREQTEEEKRLLGNIAPQRLDTVAAASAAASSSSDISVGVHTNTNAADTNSMSSSTFPSSASPTGTTATELGASGGASAWNQAGTWEERDTTEWCTSSLTNFLKESQVHEKDDDSAKKYTAKIKKVKDLSGDASVVLTRGKKRYVFDYHCKLKYEIMDEKVLKKVVASGEFRLPDISSTAVSDGEELEVDVLGWSKAPSSEDGIVKEVMLCRDALVHRVRSQVKAFVMAFNEQF